MAPDLLADLALVFLAVDLDAVLVPPFLAVFFVVAIVSLTPGKGRANF